MDLKIEEKAKNYHSVRLTDRSVGVDVSFGLLFINKDDIDSICEARDKRCEVTSLCLLEDGKIAILQDIFNVGKHIVGTGVIVTHYNKHPLVSKKRYSSIRRHVVVTQPVVEGVVLAGDVNKYFSTR